MKQLLAKVKGQGSFEVDETFVFEHLGDQIDDQEREIMNLFVDQSQNNVQGDASEMEQKSEGEDVEASDSDSVNGSEVEPVEGAFYRICNVVSKPCDDSPLEDIEYPDRMTGRKNSIFGHEGQMIKTDGTGRNTKLTKVYKRGDNRGALLDALKRMKLCED